MGRRKLVQVLSKHKTQPKTIPIPSQFRNSAISSTETRKKLGEKKLSNTHLISDFPVLYD
ncbi:hypothetical protein QQP08_022405 [Theobroma cacao]|nr:hypothetical protein QQP08_022405 [Theobroma cacao]